MLNPALVGVPSLGGEHAKPWSCWVR